MNLVRILFWICLVIAWIGVCNCAWISWRASRPEQGAILYLMLAGYFGPPMVFAAIFASGLILVDGNSFQRWERRLVWLAGVLTVGICGVGVWLFGV